MDSSTNNGSERQRHFDSLSFVGEITASVTHELNNILGTIEQVTGLIEDMADTDEIKDSGIAEKLQSVVNRVGKQAERGAALIKRLNSFAHLTDKTATACNLGELLEIIVALSERKVQMRKATLVTVGFDQEIVVTAGPLAVVQFVYAVIKKAVAMADPAEPIRIGLARGKAGAEITLDVLCSRAAPEEAPVDNTAACAAWLGGHIEEKEAAGRRTITLVIPYDGRGVP